MIENISDTLYKNINKFRGDSIIVEESGFIECKFFIEKMNFSIEYDILHLFDDKNESFLKINLNQIYNLDCNHESFKIFLDNDITIILKR